MKKIAILLFSIIILSSCDNNLSESKRGRTYYIDTVSIHGVEHEFIVRYKFCHQAEIFQHSPECQCMKKNKEFNHE